MPIPSEERGSPCGQVRSTGNRETVNGARALALLMGRGWKGWWVKRYDKSTVTCVDRMVTSVTDDT
jgi:hypothetical protein